MMTIRIRLTLAAAALAVTLAACGSSGYGSNSKTTTAAGAGSATTTPAPITTAGTTGGYGYPAPTAAATTAPAAATTAATTGGASVALASVGTFGQVLVDANGMSLYLFTKDAGGTSACTGACATNWPAAVVSGTPSAGAGLDASKLSTLKRDDGTTQLVYNGHPLYTFAGDAAAGQAGGQGSGGIWFLVNAAGDQVTGGAVPGY
jgi:predicted lipoprotein with Yx(FWY)xxD motif